MTQEKMIKLFAGSDGAEETPPSETTPPAPAENKPTDSEAKLIKEVMAKKEQIAEQGKKIQELEANLSAFNELGGIDALKKMVETQRAAEKMELEKKGEWDKLKEQMVAEHDKATAGLKQEITDLKSQILAEKNKVSELTVGSAFSGSEYLKNKTILTPAKARIIYGGHFDISETGQVVAYDKPRGTEGRTPLVDQSGNGVSFEVAIERIIAADPDRDSMLRAPGKQGSGSGTEGAPNKPVKTKTKSSLDMIASGLAGLK